MGTREELLQNAIECLQECNLDALELLNNCFIQTFKGNERYSIHTPDARVAELKAEFNKKMEQEKAEELAKQKEAEEQYTEFLQNNSTMKLLGASTCYRLISGDGKYFEQGQDVLKSYSYHRSIYNLMIEAFSLGVICADMEHKSKKN